MNLDLTKLNAAGANITAELVRIRESVGAAPGDYEAKSAVIEITGADMQKLAAANPGKPIIIKGKLHLAYIKDHDNDRFYSKANRAAKTAANGCYWGGNKLHFYYCQTLQTMKSHGRQHRYRQTLAINSTQTIDLPEEKNRRTRLAWCQFCIREFQSALSRTPEVAGGSEWLGGQPAQLATSGDAETLKQFFRPSNPLWSEFVKELNSPAAPSDYPANWGSISAAFRKEKEYKCAVCSVDCGAHPALTDAHHINGDKANCNYKNLQCLCKYHHSQQPMHEHYKPKESEMQILRQLWEEQKIPADLRG